MLAHKTLGKKPTMSIKFSFQFFIILKIKGIHKYSTNFNYI